MMIEFHFRWIIHQCSRLLRRDAEWRESVVEKRGLWRWPGIKGMRERSWEEQLGRWPSFAGLRCSSAGRNFSSTRPPSPQTRQQARGALAPVRPRMDDRYHTGTERMHHSGRAQQAGSFNWAMQPRGSMFHM